MRYIWIITLFLAPSLWAETQFLPLPQDFPIMDGLKIEKSKETIFSNLEGRIMIYVAHTKESVKTVEEFYRNTLKNLGWKLHPKNFKTFIRQLEQVELNFEPHGNQTEVTFTFKPCS